MKLKLVIIPFLFLLLIPSVYATVTITPNVELRTSGTNVSYFVSQNMTVNRIEVTSTFLNITNSSGDFVMYVKPSSGSLNITIYNFTITYKKWAETTSNTSLTTQHIIGNLTPNANIDIKRNSFVWNTYTSNASGYIDFNYNSGYSTITFEAELHTAAVSEEEISEDVFRPVSEEEITIEENITEIPEEEVEEVTEIFYSWLLLIGIIIFSFVIILYGKTRKKIKRRKRKRK